MSEIEKEEEMMVPVELMRDVELALLNGDKPWHASRVKELLDARKPKGWPWNDHQFLKMCLEPSSIEMGQKRFRYLAAHDALSRAEASLKTLDNVTKRMASEHKYCSLPSESMKDEMIAEVVRCRAELEKFSQ